MSGLSKWRLTVEWSEWVDGRVVGRKLVDKWSEWSWWTRIRSGRWAIVVDVGEAFVERMVGDDVGVVAVRICSAGAAYR